MNKKEMEKLFDNDKYTEIANDLDRETYNAIVKIFDKYARYYSIREIEYIMQKTITDISLDKLLNWDEGSNE